jgi:signal transduction histidine kinase
VGCCNESEHRHALRHFEETGHPVIRSLEPDDDWRWCFLDHVFLSGENQTITKDMLCRLPLFAGLPADALDELFDYTELFRAPAGTVLMEEGAPGDAVYIILEGRVEIYRGKEGQKVLLAERDTGDFVGEMALLEQAPRSATVRTVEDSRLMVVHGPIFWNLLARSPETTLSVLRTVMAGLRGTESMLIQQEKMAALGTLAAGLAHELNNPAAAVRRASDHLRAALDGWRRAALALSQCGLEAEQLGVLGQVATQRMPASANLTPLARATREEEMGDWLDAKGVDDAYDLASALVAAGWQPADLMALPERFTARQLPVVVAWLARQAAALDVLAEIESSAGAISQIVRAVKTYSYLDQTPLQDVDVEDSLETTLVILKHKLKEGVTIVREYAEDLPHIEAYGSELNQVWTNIIDNAVDAMEGKGTLTIRTAAGDDCVLVEIVDSGPGMPPEVRDRIFEPFFTTKPMGSGTGLGLHIAYNVVVHKHHGNIEVESQPGETVFRVTLPLRLE